MAAMPNKIMWGGGNGLGREVMAIYPEGPNVRGGEPPRVGLPAREKMALDKRLSCQTLDLASHGFRRFHIAGGYAVSAERRRLPGPQGTKKEGVYLGGAVSMQHSLELGECEGSYPSGEVKKAQSSVLGGGKTCLGGSVSGESSGSIIVGPNAVLDGDNLSVPPTG